MRETGRAGLGFGARVVPAPRRAGTRPRRETFAMPMRDRRGRGKGGPGTHTSTVVAHAEAAAMTGHVSTAAAVRVAQGLRAETAGGGDVWSALRGCLDTGIPSLLQTVGARRYVSIRDGLLTFETGSFETTRTPTGPLVRRQGNAPTPFSRTQLGNGPRSSPRYEEDIRYSLDIVWLAGCSLGGPNRVAVADSVNVAGRLVRRPGGHRGARRSRSRDPAR